MGSMGSMDWESAAEGTTATATPPAPAPAPSGSAAPPPTAAPGQAQQTLNAAQNPDRSSADTTSPTTNAPVTGSAPLALRPAREGLLGMVDKIADVLTGKTTPEIYKDDQGNSYVYHPAMTRGQQWERIASEAIVGAGAGAAQVGPGNKGRAAAAGVQAGVKLGEEGQEKEKDVTNEARQANLDKANNQILQMNMAKNAWEMARMKIKASQEDITFNDNQEKQLTDQGGRLIGTAAHPGDIADILKVQPDIMKQLVQKGTVQIRHNIDADGNVIGVKAFLMPESWAKTLLPAGTVGHVYDPIENKITEFHYADPVTQGEVAIHDAAAVTARDKIAADQREAKLKAAQTKEANVNADTKADESPSKIGLQKAEAKRDIAEAGKMRSESVVGDMSPEQSNDAAEGLSTGRYLMGKDFPLRTTKDQATARELNQAAQQYSMTHFGLPYSPEKVREESHFASNEKTQAYLNSIDRMIGTPGIPGQLDQVLSLATQAGVTDQAGGFLGLNTPISQVKQYVRRRLGDTAAKQFEQGLSDTQTALGTLIGNPLLGGGESDLKLKTAQSQYGKDVTLSNLKAANATVGEILGRARKQLARNNRFIQQRYGDAYSPDRQVSVVLADGKTMGQVPAANLDKFLSENKGAKQVE